MKKTFLTLFGVLSLVFWGCDTIFPKKVEPFYCKINGSKFVPQTDNSPFGGVGSSPLKITRDLKYGWLYITALNNPEDVSLYIKLSSNEEIEMKEYPLSNDTTKSMGNYYYNILASNKERLISTNGKLIITKVEGKKFWGTFEFSTKSTKNNQEFNITDGQLNGLSY